MNRENKLLQIINETVADNSFLGQDCAYLKDFKLLISQDTLVENVHFKTSYFTPFEIGKKAVLVNISDILASGGIPKYISISLSGPLNEDFVREFYLGVNEICMRYKIKVTGGDLTGGDKIMVSVCIIGKNENKILPEKENARAGDEVYLIGFHGSSALGLMMLLNGEKTENEFIKAHKEPVLYQNEALFISKNVTCPYVMTDTSDGLYDALSRVSIASGVGFDIDYDKIPKKVSDKNLVLFGGEDFGLFICLKPQDENIARKLNLTKIGTVTGTNKIFIDRMEVSADNRYNHFE